MVALFRFDFQLWKDTSKGGNIEQLDRILPDRGLVMLRDRFGPADAVILKELSGIAKTAVQQRSCFNPPIALLVDTHGVTGVLQMGISMDLEPDLDPLILVQARSD